MKYRNNIPVAARMMSKEEERTITIEFLSTTTVDRNVSYEREN
jgi:hypothetical protein